MKPQEKKLLNLFRNLSEKNRQTVLDFAEFLGSRNEVRDEVIAEPVLIAAKEDETVVGALKRLSNSYPMLDKSKMLNDTSVLVAQHVVQGRKKQEVIRELEEVFAQHYQRLIEERKND